jgi:hypothetical protein
MFKDQRKLKGFYWGYKADQGEDGFEFTNKHLTDLAGMPIEEALELGARLKKTADAGVTGVLNNDPAILEGKTQEEFIDEEYERLLWVIEVMRPAQGKTIAFPKYMEYNMIACCAISILVAAGRIPQDTWNGDSFMEQVELEAI